MQQEPLALSGRQAPELFLNLEFSYLCYEVPHPAHLLRHSSIFIIHLERLWFIHKTLGLGKYNFNFPWICFMSQALGRPSQRGIRLHGNPGHGSSPLKFGIVREELWVVLEEKGWHSCMFRGECWRASSHSHWVCSAWSDISMQLAMPLESLIFLPYLHLGFTGMHQT